jgi:hypothetical protein
MEFPHAEREVYKIREPAYKPGFVPLLGTVIYLAGRLPGRSSSLPGSHNGPDRSCSPIWPCSRWGLPSQPVTRLLVGSYPAISPLPDIPAVSFCCTFPILGPTLRTSLGRWTLSTTVSCGARTFLSPAPPRKRARTSDSDRPADSRMFFILSTSNFSMSGPLSIKRFQPPYQSFSRLYESLPT